jgi:hypothetical protein
MKRWNRARLCLGLVLSALLAAAPAAAQVTTGSITGVVRDQQGGVLPGVTVEALHAASGTTYAGVTQGDGRFSLLSLRVGSYTVKVTLSGFRDALQTGVIVALGEEVPVSFTMEVAAVAEEVTVSAETPPVDITMAGTAAHISSAVKDALPTISRSMNDIIRTSAYVNLTGLNDDVPAPSIAGRNYRYNSVQIDGAVNNDLFGLAASGGTPGGATETAPISLDAIQELQVVVSPYDVRQGGFSGGGINAITKSGTNQLSGTVFYYGRNQDWVGVGPNDSPIATFSDKQGGFSIGGPAARNKAFFFGNADWGRKSTPSGFSIAGSGTQVGSEAGVDRFLSILRDTYGYDLGSGAKDEFVRGTVSDKVFVRGDFNLADRHKLTVRHNYVDAANDIGFPSSSIYRMPDGFYHFTSKTNSTVGQINSAFANAVNEFRVAYTTVRDVRGGQEFEPRPFPFVDVTVSPTLRVRAGRENFSTANELDQDVLEINNDFTMVRGEHTITVGTHNEFFDFRNLFIRDNFGNYSFNSLDNFEAGIAQAFSYSFSATADPLQASEFGVNQIGFYVGDQWRARPNLTITAGVRVDRPIFPDTPTENPVAEDNFGFATNVVPASTLWSPRVGFNYDLSGVGTEQVRGGIGLFTGRTPFVWLSNQYGNTGIEFTRLSRSFNNNNQIPFEPDAFNQPETLTGGSFATNEIDLVDPDYKFPSLVRGNLAYDREVARGVVATAELLFSSNVNDIKYQNLNLVQTGTSNLDGRPIYGRAVTALSDVIFLTNTSEGGAWSLNFEMRRQFRDGWYAQGSYTYGESTSILDGTSSQAASNWGNAYIGATGPNDPPNTRSNFDPGHRLSFSAAYDVMLPREMTLTISAFYSGQSGRPYTLSYSRDVNGDGRGFNDNLYLPASADEVTLTGGSYDDLLAFLQTDDCLASQIGTIMERNSCRSPWNNTLDARLNFGLPFRTVKAEVTLDILNVLNLFGKDNGVFEYVNFNQVTIFNPSVSGGQVNSIGIAPLAAQDFNPYTIGDLRSRWQLQLGGRIRF